ncbi:MAG TPA: UDP-N-acetylmuramoyl-tripeptide--D-alanyl-D-alanine ligase [Solirubrobacteraceae bacterium]|nr:UDP-N-acetylmuramoyl-tripeptide--D-alanyl-D-alanine ligase [Solirubrobacteraceae bacterium]
MRRWNSEQIAQAAGARVASARDSEGGPERAVIDSREAGPDVLFIGLPGSQTDGGRFAGAALEAGAWGAIVAEEHVESARQPGTGGAILVASDPLRALQRLATAWRRELGARVIGVTGSTGKTSTKDLLLTVLAPHVRTVASRANFNTEVGLPLEVLAAPAGTEVLVLEMAMRGAGQIAELAEIAEPDVGVIVSIGPVHLELLGTIEAIAAAKAELVAGLPSGATAVVPASEPLLEPHLRADVETITFGEGGDVRLLDAEGDRLRIQAPGGVIDLEVSFTQAHLRRNLLAAVAAAGAVGVVPSGRVELALTPGRGQRARLGSGVTLIDDCYNANPMSMRAALEDLAESARNEAGSRRVAVLGDMLELGPDEHGFHAEVGEQAAQAGVELLVTVGPRAAAMSEHFAGHVCSVQDAAEAATVVPELLHTGDVVLVKGSRGVGLELVCRALRNGGDGS